MQTNFFFKSLRNVFFKKSENFSIFLFAGEKNAIFLVLTIKEISLRPELSSPRRFRIQGWYPERDGVGVLLLVAGRDLRIKFL